MKKQKKRGTAVPTYVDVDPDTGMEKQARKRKKHFNRFPAFATPDKKQDPILPATDLQKQALRVAGKTLWDSMEEMERFTKLEDKFIGEHHKLERAVWVLWMEKMIAWAENKKIKSTKPICTAIDNRENWGRFWNENRYKMARTTTISSGYKSVVANAYKEQDDKW